MVSAAATTRRTLEALALALAFALAACSSGAASAAPSPSVDRAEPSATGSAIASAATIDSAAPSASADVTLVDPPDAGAASPCVDPAMARIGRFCVDKWEARLEAELADGGWSPLPANERPPDDVDYRAASEPGVLPQAYISRVEASRACKSAGKRLCSMTEFRRACQGKAGGHYPYGTKAKRGACNIGKPHLLALKFGADAHHWTYEHFNDPSLDVEDGFLAKTGEYQGCESAAGTFDMSGNLHEWVSDTVDEAFVARLEADKVERKTQPSRTGDGVFVGGFFSTTDQHGPGCLFTTIAHEPSYHDYSIGFRCCADARVDDEPAKATKKKPKRR
ncbi:MAG TPA: SUMF1/EgtB/PvdO family nonheme iron enzyme [Byssovorax sp.]